MALKIRLRQQGRTNRSVYRIVVADSRSPRDGRFVEVIGWYNPLETELEKVIFIDVPRLQHWVNNGAQLTDKTAILAKKVAPAVIEAITQREVANRAKAVEKRKARKKAAAA